VVLGGGQGECPAGDQVNVKAGGGEEKIGGRGPLWGGNAIGVRCCGIIPQETQEGGFHSLREPIGKDLKPWVKQLIEGGRVMGHVQSMSRKHKKGGKEKRSY